MACRKAAYRAEIELSEWMQKKQEEADKKMARLETEIKETWTPPSILEDCCMLWLKDGPEILGIQGQGNKGCSGGCGKDHPRITLDFDDNKKKAVAVISHELDPFLNYFDELCRQGKAKNVEAKQKDKSKRYLLSGFLQAFSDDVKTSNLPDHLVKIPATALAASQRAHQRQMELDEEQRESKRRKLRGKTDYTNNSLLEAVLEVCWNHGTLLEHIDVAETAWMRLTSKTLAKFAARMARARMDKIVFSYRLRNNLGTYSGGDHLILWRGSGLNSESPRLETFDRDCNPCQFLFTPRTNKAISFCQYLHPDNAIQNTIEIIVFLERPSDQTDLCPEKESLFSRHRLQVASHRFVINGSQEEAVSSENGFEYKLKIDHEGQGESNGAEKLKVTFALQSSEFDFKDLLGIYVRKKLPLEKKRMQENKAKRPVSRSEKAYVKALAKEARLAPGSADDFRGKEGW